MEKIIFDKVTKKFGDVTANKNISFSVKENEVHALLGENGAGKSTLMSILFGLYSPTEGRILINGVEERIRNPRDPNKLKIAMLPQHFKLVDNMSVLDNVILGFEKLNKDVEGTTKEILKGMADKFDIEIDLSAIVSSLSISDKQKVEILKILWRNADIIIFDEPTSILTPAEIDSFLKMVLDMKKDGKTILIITHKLNEIKQVADRVTIIRKGVYISTNNVKTTTENKMAELMVGKAVNLNFSNIKKTIVRNPKTILKVENLSYAAGEYECSLDDISFEIKEGEILGIAAIDGNGQSELIKSISGIFSHKGKVVIDNVDISNKNIHNRYWHKESLTERTDIQKNDFKEARIKMNKLHKENLIELKNAKKQLTSLKRNKEQDETSSKELEKQQMVVNHLIAETKESEIQKQHAKLLEITPVPLLSHVPEDRHKYGLLLDLNVSENSILQELKYYSTFGFIDKKSRNTRLNSLVEKFDIRGITSPKTSTRGLSGGNQQKLILAREILRMPKVLIAAHPTRGLDVGAIRSVFENIVEIRNQGSAVLLSSGELDEIMQISDKIMVLCDGKIVSVTKKGKLSKTQIGKLMAGNVKGPIKKPKKKSVKKVIKKPKKGSE